MEAKSLTTNPSLLTRGTPQNPIQCFPRYDKDDPFDTSKLGVVYNDEATGKASNFWLHKLARRAFRANSSLMTDNHGDMVIGPIEPTDSLWMSFYFRSLNNATAPTANGAAVGAQATAAKVAIWGLDDVIAGARHGKYREQLGVPLGVLTLSSAASRVVEAGGQVLPEDASIVSAIAITNDYTGDTMKLVNNSTAVRFDKLGHQFIGLDVYACYNGGGDFYGVGAMLRCL